MARRIDVSEPPLIGIAGRKFSGKSTSAKHLCEVHGYIVVKMAEPLKHMLRVIGLSERHIEGDLKEAPCELLRGRTPRHAMRTLGHEWGREMISEDLWVWHWQQKVSPLLRAGAPVLADDVRFPAEVAAVREMGGKVIRISRPGLPPPDHPTEAEIGSMAVDIQVVNDGDIRRLHDRLDAAIKALC